MNFFINQIFKRNAKPSMLGRWLIPDCQKVVDRKIDMANIDNCGPCLYSHDMPGLNPSINSPVVLGKKPLYRNQYQETSIDLLWIDNHDKLNQIKSHH